MAKKELPNPQTVEELIALLQQETEKRQKNKQTVGAVFAAVVIVYLLLAAILWWVKGEFPGQLFSNIGSMAALIGAGAAATATHKHALKIATENMDPRLTGYFIEALDIDDKKVVESVREALAARLPLLTDEQYHQLTDAQREGLAKSVAKPTDLNYTRAALSALQQFAGAEAIDPLETLTKSSLPKKNKDDFEKVKISAQLVLADIRMRLAQSVIRRKEEETAALTQRALSDVQEVATITQL